MLPAVVIVLREILVSGLREYMAEARVGLPVARLAKWKTAVQMVAIGFLIVGDAGPDWLPVTPIGWWGLWVAAALTLVTGWGYLQTGLATCYRGADEAAASAAERSRVGRAERLRIRYFAWLKQRAGCAEEAVAPPAEVATRSRR